MAIAETRPPIDAPHRLFTAADLAEMPDELPSGPVKYELDNGRLVTMPPTGADHGDAQLRIGSALLALGDLRGGAAFVETGVILWRNPDRVVGPDVSFVSKASLPVRLSPEGYLETIPDLVVEVVSKNDTRPFLQRKVDDYLKAGVRAVWVVDPATCKVAEHRPHAEVREFGRADTLTLDDIIPGFALDLRLVFPPESQTPS